MLLGDSGAVELTLLSFYKQLILQEALKDLSNMKNVFLGRTSENQDVVEVEKYKTIQHVPEHIALGALLSPNGLTRYS
jgi:hypothetical protein